MNTGGMMNLNKEIIKYIYILLITWILVIQPIFGVMSQSDTNQFDTNNTNQFDTNDTNQSNNIIVKDICNSKYPVFCIPMTPPEDVEFPLIEMVQ